MEKQQIPPVDMPADIMERAWDMMQQWQTFVGERPDDECAVALFVLMAHTLLSSMAYTHAWTHDETLLYWYRTLVPQTVEICDTRWEKCPDE